jgi:hypothetical protein
LSGVRSSCETVATNSSFARLSASRARGPACSLEGRRPLALDLLLRLVTFAQPRLEDLRGIGKRLRLILYLSDR